MPLLTSLRLTAHRAWSASFFHPRGGWVTQLQDNRLDTPHGHGPACLSRSLRTTRARMSHASIWAGCGRTGVCADLQDAGGGHAHTQTEGGWVASAHLRRSVVPSCSLTSVGAADDRIEAERAAMQPYRCRCSYCSRPASDVTNLCECADGAAGQCQRR
jgi:hypothetical protein